MKREACLLQVGIELRSGLSFKHYKDKIVAEARKRMMLVWAMGMREGALGVEDCIRAWQALVRPVLEYGTVVWGDVKWEQAERVQREMGKMILRCSPKMANEVVLGELGWWTLKGRRDFLTLNYWGKIVGGWHLHVLSITSITLVAHDMMPITTTAAITAQTDGATTFMRCLKT